MASSGGGEIDAFLAFGRPMGKQETRVKIEGETTDVIETKEVEGLARSIQLKSYTAQFSSTTDATEQTTETEAPRFEPGEFSITKFVDAASPAILTAMSLGSRWETVVVSQRKAGGTPGMSGDYFWLIELEKVTIERLSWTADEGAPTETVGLKYYGAINVWYWKQKHSGELEKTALTGFGKQDQSVKSKNKGTGTKDDDKSGVNGGKMDSQLQATVKKLVEAEIKKHEQLKHR